MAVNKVEICGLDTSKLPMMTYERSTELLKKISEGDEAARDIFIKENLRLVLSVIPYTTGVVGLMHETGGINTAAVCDASEYAD